MNKIELKNKLQSLKKMSFFDGLDIICTIAIVIYLILCISPIKIKNDILLFFLVVGKIIAVYAKKLPKEDKIAFLKDRLKSFKKLDFFDILDIVCTLTIIIYIILILLSIETQFDFLLTFALFGKLVAFNAKSMLKKDKEQKESKKENE